MKFTFWTIPHKVFVLFVAVTRFKMKGDSTESELTIDIATHVYKLESGNKIRYIIEGFSSQKSWLVLHNYCRIRLMLPVLPRQTSLPPHSDTTYSHTIGSFVLANTLSLDGKPDDGMFHETEEVRWLSISERLAVRIVSSMEV